MSGWNDILSMMLGLVSSFGFFKFLKLLKFNKNIFYIGLTFKLCLDDLSSFSILFAIVFSAFAQVFYLIFNQDLWKFQSMISSVETCFEMMLGKFEVETLLRANGFLGMIFFLLFHLTVVMIVVNCLVTIICDGYTTVRFDPKTKKLNKENEEIKECLIGKIKRFFGMDEEEGPGGKKGKKVLMPDPEYMTPTDTFPATISRLSLFVNDVLIPSKNNFLEFDDRNAKYEQEEAEKLRQVKGNVKRHKFTGKKY